MKQKLKMFTMALVMVFGVATALSPAAYATSHNEAKKAICEGVNLGGGSDCGGAGATQSVNGLAKTVVNLLSFIIGIVAVIMIIIGGLKYITSSGESANVTSAKNTILYAVIGLVVVVFAQILVRFVLSTAANSAPPAPAPTTTIESRNA